MGNRILEKEEEEKMTSIPGTGPSSLSPLEPTREVEKEEEEERAMNDFCIDASIAANED